jgi:ribosomal protein L28
VRSNLTVSSAGIGRGRRRFIAAANVRRVHLFTYENGDTRLVVRGKCLRLVSLSGSELVNTSNASNLVALLQAVSSHATIDTDVERFLTPFAPSTAFLLSA